jgi:hypothetical protein
MRHLRRTARDHARLRRKRARRLHASLAMGRRTARRDTARAMSQENVEIVRKTVQAFLDNDFEAWFAITDPGCKLYPRPEALGLSEHDAHDGS